MRRKMFLFGLAAASLIGLADCGKAPKPAPQSPSARTTYDPLKAFARQVFPDPPGATRAADGTPGPAYWQNRADYTIHAVLDPASDTLSADEIITYTNNSPNDLDYVWLQLDQNIYRRNARSGFTFGVANPSPTEGVFESEDFHGGEFGPKRDSEFSPKSAHPADGLVALLADPKAPVTLTAGDQVTETYRHPVSYYKSAFGMVLLRDTILGPDRFDYAFRKFIRDWAFKHSSPSDFFRAMDSAAGEDLSWFWREWYFGTGTYDVAVTSVAPVKGDWKNGAIISLENRDAMVFPITVEARYLGGRSVRINVPAEAWMRSATAKVTLPGYLPLNAVNVDPDHALPDHDRANNVWSAP